MTEKPESVGREVLYDVVEGHIGLVRLNRPDKRNAVNGDVATAMDWIVKETERDPEIRVVILTSSSPDFCCAGADLSELSKGRGHLLAPADGGFAG
ncbi:MAG: enoyl-CoA hydratase/isomerase family protein, partial [Sandaracinobacter sp.]